MSLKISVNDQVKIVDGLPQAIEEIQRIIQEWVLVEDQETPLVITIHKNETRGPPALGIHVSDLMDIKTLLR